MPKDAELLTVQLQYGVPMLWAVVNPFAPGRPYRTIFIHGTGHPVDPRAQKYVATFQVSGGDLVFHVFDGVEK